MSNPTRPYLATLTDKQLGRLGNRLYARIRDWATGDPFGWDWPTLWACEPGLARDFRSVIDEFQARHDRTKQPTA